jgi:amino acid transporter
MLFSVMILWPQRGTAIDESTETRRARICRRACHGDRWLCPGLYDHRQHRCSRCRLGLAGPAALWVAFIPMIGITLAFFYLNQWRSDAGAAYAWIGRAVNPALGFLAGWALLSHSTIFMVAAALPAALATLDLFAPGEIHNVAGATAIGTLWFLGVLTLVTCGITKAAKVQTFMTFLELGALILIGGLVIWHAHNAPAAAFSWNWFLPSGFGSAQAFSAGMLVALFYYLGWDVSANLAEETRNARVVAGIGGLFGVIVIFLLFLLLTIAAQMSLTPDEIEANSANLLPTLCRIALPGYWSAIAVLAVLVSSVGTLETQLLQCTRLLYSMARDGVIGEPMGRLHSHFQTPWLAGLAIAGVSLLLFAASATVPTLNQLMSELIAAIGVQVSFYYATAAFACAWYYRKAMPRNWGLLVFAGIVPLVSSLFVAAVGLSQLLQLGWRVSVISIGTILIGLAPLWYYRRHYRSRFYTDPPEHAPAKLGIKPSLAR